MSAVGRRGRDVTVPRDNECKARGLPQTTTREESVQGLLLHIASPVTADVYVGGGEEVVKSVGGRRVVVAVPR